jgi:hypothetical protein
VQARIVAEIEREPARAAILIHECLTPII